MKLLGVFNFLLISIVVFGRFVNADSVTEFDETKIQAPFVDSNEEPLLSTVCRSRSPFLWDRCASVYEDNREQMKEFRFTNWGENKIVPKAGFGIGRDFVFMFEGFARSDLGLLIWDVPDQDYSHSHLKLMMFFPRVVLPAIRHFTEEGKNQIIVTLPTKEEVVFDSKSKEILSGSLIEGPMKQDSKGYALNPGVSYSGDGVVIEADRINDYPVGLNSISKDNLATISKKGFKDCKVPTKELWYADEKKNENVYFNKKYVTDEAFDQFLKERCKFSMYR